MKYNFTPNDKEWHQTLLNAFENLLKLQVKPVLVYDRKQFRKYLYRGGHNANSVSAECIKDCGIIWLSPFLSACPKVEAVNTLYHECLHIKYPNMHENKVRQLADKMIPITSVTNSKKKKFDIVHKK